MIVRLDRQKQRTARHQLLGDVAYIISHEALKQMQREGHTELSPEEVFMSARKFCDAILELPDIEEGLEDEMDDLEDEVSDQNDSMLIMLVATVLLQAISKQRVGIDFRKIIFRIFERLDGHELLGPLIEQMTSKEEERWLQGKRFNLLDYEIKEIELDGGGIEEKKRFLDEFVEITLKLTDDEIRGTLLPLYSLNMKYGHVFDEQIIKLFDKLGIPTAEIHNHFEKDSHCQVFNSSVTGKFENK